MIAALILAAGPSSRLGRPKQVEPWGDTTLLGRVVKEMAETPVDEVWVVLGANMDAVLEAVDLSDFGLVENPEWSEGIASSLRVGLDAINRMSKSEWALLVMGDQPGVGPEVVTALIEHSRRTRSTVIIPKYRYATGTPVLVARSLWPRLMSMEGDGDPEQLFAAHPEWIDEVWFEDLAPRDVNTELDVQELRPRR